MSDPLEVLTQSIDRTQLWKEAERLEDEIQERARRLNQLQTLMRLIDELDPEPQLARQEAARPSLADSILIVMREWPDNTVWTADKILAGLKRRNWTPRGKTPRNSVDATLSKLRRNGALERPGPGVYKLPSTAVGGVSVAGNSAANLLDQGEEVD